MSIVSMLDISTAHITGNTGKWLGEERLHPDDPDLDFASTTLSMTAWGEYGWIIWVGDDEAVLEGLSVPNELRACMKTAHRAGALYLKLDRDGEFINLPTFNW